MVTGLLAIISGPTRLISPNITIISRGPGRCSNLVKNLLKQFFEGPIPGKIVGKTRLFREIPVKRKGRGQDGVEKCMYIYLEPILLPRVKELNNVAQRLNIVAQRVKELNIVAQRLMPSINISPPHIVAQRLGTLGSMDETTTGWRNVDGGHQKASWKPHSKEPHSKDPCYLRRHNALR